MANNQGPFILVTDDDSHWYVIPHAKVARWAVWCCSEAAELGDVPGYAKPVGGSPSLVKFEGYEIDGEVKS